MLPKTGKRPRTAWFGAGRGVTGLGQSGFAGSSLLIALRCGVHYFFAAFTITVWNMILPSRVTNTS